MKTIAPLSPLAPAFIGPAVHAAAAPVLSLKSKAVEKGILFLGERSLGLRATRLLKGVDFPEGPPPWSGQAL